MPDKGVQFSSNFFVLLEPADLARFPLEAIRKFIRAFLRGLQAVKWGLQLYPAKSASRSASHSDVMTGWTFTIFGLRPKRQQVYQFFPIFSQMFGCRREFAGSGLAELHYLRIHHCND